MTERLYLNNSYLLEFDATVVAVRETTEGIAVLLDKTAFYPETGGQLYDFGELEGLTVFKVGEEDSGEIWHYLKERRLPAGVAVRGKIDPERRFDNMRKHTGQHILSRAFIEVADAETVSSRLGEVESTIELSCPDLSDTILEEVEALANDKVMSNLPVLINYYGREELSRIPVRKIPDREGRFRIIQIGEFDYSACGGTHCRSTGEVGLLKIIGAEKLRGHLRVIFLTGRQALIDYRVKSQVLTRLSSKLTCHFNDLERSIEKLNEQCQVYRRETAVLSERLLANQLIVLADSAASIGKEKVLFSDFDGYDIKILKEAGGKFVQEYGGFLLLFNNDKLIVNVAFGLSPSASEIAGAIVSSGLGKGGGNAISAQIGGLPEDKREEVRQNIASFIAMKAGGR